MLSKKQKVSENSKIIQLILKILRIVPSNDLSRFWPSNRTIMMRMTSRKIRKAIDKAKLPTQLNINWEIYREIETNNVIKSLNITDLIIYRFGNLICYKEKNFEWDPAVQSFKLAILLYHNKNLVNFKICGLCNKSLKYLKPAFQNLENLSHLCLNDTDLKWSTKLIKTLMMLPKLVSLDLSFSPTDISIKELQSIKQFIHLKNLTLYVFNDCDSSYNIPEFIEMCPTLNKLILRDNFFNYEWIKRLEQALIKCSNLTYLDLTNTLILEDPEDEDKKIKRFKQIQLQCPSLEQLVVY